MSINIKRTAQKRVVIVGGGLGGLRLAQDLLTAQKHNCLNPCENREVDTNDCGEGSKYSTEKRKNSGMGCKSRVLPLQVVLIDKNNYHQFPPLIYQVASAGLAPSNISFPFRQIFRKSKNFYFRIAEARAVFPDKKILQTSIGKIEYDYLVFAAGATTNFFGNKNVEEWAIPMRTLSESMGLRNVLLSNLERALTCATEEERQELLNVVIVGGGATGVEIAGAISEMKRYVIPYDYPDMDASHMHIYLLEATDRLLTGMSDESSNKALEFLKGMGVDVQFGKMVTDYKDFRVMIKDGTSIPTRTFLWVSGIKAQPITGIEGDHLGRGFRIKVDEYNRVLGMDNIYAIGDQCLMTADPNYPNGHPQLAQVAIQQAKNLAANLYILNNDVQTNKNDKEIGKNGMLSNKNDKEIGKNGMSIIKPFRYKDLGSMATIGRNKAVADIHKIHSQGFLAWLLWLVVHLRSILGIKNKLQVMLSWAWQYFSYTGSIRTIVYATKPRIIKERFKREARTHLGTDLLEEENAKE